MTFREYLNENMEKPECPCVTYSDLISNFAMKSGSQVFEDLKTKFDGDEDKVRETIEAAAEEAAKMFIGAVESVEQLPPSMEASELEALKDFDDGNKVTEEGPKEEPEKN